VNKLVEAERTAPPPDLRAALMPTVPVIVDAAIAAIRRREKLADSERALEHNLRLGLTNAVDRWFEGAPLSADLELHFALGRAQARSGRSLDELMGFYRLAAQAIWRRLTEVAAERGLAPADLYRLAETGFGCVEEISTQAAAGYADEHSHRSGTSRSRRGELVRLLLKTPPPDPDALREAGLEAGVELTATIAIYAGPAGRYDDFARGAREQILLGPLEDGFVGVLLDPDGPGRRRALEIAAERCGAELALGPAVAIAQARASLARARALLALSRAGHLPPAPLVQAEGQEAALLLSGDPDLAAALGERLLAPLAAVRGAGARANLTLTLGAWLHHQGQRKAVAHELGVHPQTVRYRMQRLRELFGDSLEDPDGRFELELALRAAPFAPSREN
jgi:hypothetical protein